MIKKILVLVLALIVLLVATVVVLAFSISGDYKVERAVTINKPKSEVFSYLKILKNQNDWGAWAKKDPAMQMDFRGTDGTPGFVSAWKSDHDEVGSGEQEIKRVVEGERIDTELRFMEPFNSKSDAYMITEAVGEDQTKVRWGFSGTMPKPFNIMSLFFDMDKEIGKDFDEGLNTLKSKLESK